MSASSSIYLASSEVIKVINAANENDSQVMSYDLRYKIMDNGNGPTHVKFTKWSLNFVQGGPLIF